MRHFAWLGHRKLSACMLGATLIGANMRIAGYRTDALEVTGDSVVKGKRPAISRTVTNPVHVSRASTERTRADLVPVNDSKLNLSNLDDKQTEGTTSPK